MPREIHVCIGCGKDTTARGAICLECYSYAFEPVVGDFDDRDEYEKEIDQMLGYEIDKEKE